MTGAAGAVTRRPVCTTPSPYAPAPEVCGGCGNDLAKHKASVADVRDQAVKAAMWKVLIALGGPHDAMSRGPSLWQSGPFREHMAACGIDWKRTGPPEIHYMPVFDDTEHGDSMVEMMAGHLRCACGSYNASVSVTGLSLGELMWHAAHIDDDVPPVSAR